MGRFVQSGGSNIGGGLTLGDAPGGTGSYEFSGGWVGWGTQYVGYSGMGSFVQSAGVNSLYDLYVGYSPGAMGSYVLTGGSLIDVGFEEFIGHSGVGNFIQTGGTHVAGYWFYLGSSPGGTGTYNLSGVPWYPIHGTRSIWAGSAVLKQIEERPWLNKFSDQMLEQANDPFVDRRHLYRAYWQRYKLPKLAKSSNCNFLFVPGGLDTSGFRPMATMSRNLLPFEWKESLRYGLSLATLRLLLLRLMQARTFRKSEGVIFLTNYARDAVTEVVHLDTAKTVVIPHGIGIHFFSPPRKQRSIEECSLEAPFQILYVSTIDLYKHQWHVAAAVAQLRASGLPVTLDLVGPAYRVALKRLQKNLERLGSSSGFIRYRGLVPYEELHKLYAVADLKVFASSCENMPNILMEAMAAGLPIACSKRGPMPEVLGEAGVYFDPERPEEIASAIRLLVESPQLRTQMAQMAFERAHQYSWERCANETFSFLAECARRYEL